MRCDDAHTLSVNTAGSSPASGGDGRTFRFEAVLGPQVAQGDVMTKCGVRHLLDSVLAGYTATVLAYGQTGSGKTFTMSGREDADAQSLDGELEESGLARDDGLILRSLAYMYARMAQLQAGEGAPRFRVKASYLEIYNEAVYDLLEPEDTGEQLQVRWDGNAFHVPQARRVTCDSLEEALQVVAVGARNRRVGSHELNKDSSRSHALCSLYVESKRSGVQGVTQGKVSFVDLAGSERLKASKSAGIMQTETGSINRSLMALGKVISALSEHGGRAGAAHIPYRDSKLTKLLMDSLGGGSLALMIACCSPSAASIEETLSTLTYATRAKNIINAPAVHTTAGSGGAGSGAGAGADVNALRKEVEALKAENATLRAVLASAGFGGELSLDGLGLGASVLSGGAYTSHLLPGVGPRPQATQARGLPLFSGSLHDVRSTTEDAALLAALPREELMSRLDDVRGTLAGLSVAAAQSAAENEALRVARNEMQAQHAAAVAQAGELAAKLHDLEAVFMGTDSDAFPPAMRARVSSIMSSGSPSAAPGTASGAAILAHPVGEAADCDDGESSGSELEEYYRARTAPMTDVPRLALEGIKDARRPSAPSAVHALQVSGDGESDSGDDYGGDEAEAHEPTVTADPEVSPVAARDSPVSTEAEEAAPATQEDEDGLEHRERNAHPDFAADETPDESES